MRRIKAVLTGDMWMTISNLYTEAEADAMLPVDADPFVRAAVRKIYRGLQTNELLVQFPASDSEPSFILRVHFDMPEDVLENTTSCPLLTGVLPRTHPRAYAALLAEARACRITFMRVTSGWRPMLGSIVHRAGLGLDINYAESRTEHVNINRASLSGPGIPRNENVSEREQKLLAEYELAKKNAEERVKEAKAAEAQRVRNRDESKAASLREIGEAASDRANAANKAKDAAYEAWNEERDRNEPTLIRSLRDKISRNPMVFQVLDPWYIDLDTRDRTPAVPNEFQSVNEKIHKNHLHISIVDAKIL